MKYEVAATLSSGGGAIVNTSSIAGHVGIADFSLYNAGKHAVEGLTKTAALELAGRCIRVNAVAPAFIATPVVERFVGAAGTHDNSLQLCILWGGSAISMSSSPRACSYCRTSRPSRPASRCWWMAVGRRGEARGQTKAKRLRSIPSTPNRPL